MDRAPDELTREIATARVDQTRTLWNGMFQNPDSVLKQMAGRIGLELYDEAELDPHIAAVVQKRKLAVVARPWDVLPVSESPKDVEIAEWVKGVLQGLDFDRFTVALLDAVVKGFSVVELIWAVQDGRIVPGWKHRSPRRFTFKAGDAGWELRLLTESAQLEGIPVPDRKFLVHRHNPRYDNPYGNGVGPAIYWPYYFKKRGLTFWLTFADKFGNPTVIAEYEGGIHADEKTRLLQAITSLSQETGMVIPKNVAVRLLEASRGGASDTYETLCRYMDEMVSIAVLGENLTTSMTQGGSYAASKTHNQVRMEIVQADADLLSGTLNQTLIPWLVDLNFPGAKPPTVWREVKEVEDLEARSKRDLNIKALGYDPTDNYMQETYGEGWVKALPAVLPTGSQEPRVLPQGEAFAEPSPDSADMVAEAARKQIQAPLEAMIDPIRKAVEEADSLPALRDKLDTLYPDLNGAAFADLMARAMTLAGLLGHWDVLQEANTRKDGRG
jgi:phage gp29-like protein